MGSVRRHVEGHRLTGPGSPPRRSIQIGLDHEATLDERDRRRGAHYTPYPTARAVVDLALGRHDGRTPRIVDPCCGGGVFLIAALDALVAGGVSAAAALGCVAGYDIEPGAVAASRAALAEWAVEHAVGEYAERAAVSVADVLAPGWSPSFRPDVVVGNPPFAGRLLTETAAVVEGPSDGRGEGFGPYTDAAALVWATASGWVADGGVVALILPRSVLGSRDGRPAREAVLRDAGLCDLWVPPRVFAGVEVAVPVTRNGGSGPARVLSGSPPIPVGVLQEGRLDAGSWSAGLALAAGVPEVGSGGPPLGALVEATAGFRDLFYAVTANVREGDPSPGVMRVASTAMVDPGILRWGERSARIGGRRWERPVVEAAALTGTPAVAAWIERLRRPKLLVASQTRVIEAAVDIEGDTVALTPLVAVFPKSGDPDALWLALAALCAPPATAWATSRAAGTGRAAATLRLSADLVRNVPTPPDRVRWEAAARALAAGAGPNEVAAGLSAAWECDDSVTSWWRRQLPGAGGMRGGGTGR